MAVENGVATPVNTRALLIAGSDGTNSRFVRTTADGTVASTKEDVTGSGALGALNAAVSVALAGTQGVAMQLAAGTLVGTIVPEISVDGGTTWVTSYFIEPSTGVMVQSMVFGVANTAIARIIVVLGGISHVRVRVSAYTSGTANCSVRATAVQDPSLSRGTDGSFIRTILLDSQGRIIVAPAGSNSAVAGFAFGDVQLSAATTAAVRRTTLTEQTTNAQRSVVSASALDAAAGTGARTVRLTYYDQTGAGPFTETVTLNGTTPVNTVSTTICFVEKMEVLTVGSGLQNAGIITLRAAAAGGGAVVLTIGATEHRTFFALHYVPTGKTCFITGMAVSNTSTAGGNGASFFIRAQQIGVANVPDVQVSDLIRLYGQSSNVIRSYGTPIQVVGPSRVQAWCTTEGSVNINYRASFDFYDQ
jgi:hypothetical protein